MFLESIEHILNLDLGWFVGLALGNLAIAFMLFAVFYLFLDGKKLISGSFIIFATLFAFLDLETVLGVPFFTGKFMVVYYVSKLALLAMVEGSKRLGKKMIFINELQFFAAFAITVAFLR